MRLFQFASGFLFLSFLTYAKTWEIPQLMFMLSYPSLSIGVLFMMVVLMLTNDYLCLRTFNFLDMQLIFALLVIYFSLSVDCKV